jgi:SpoVK/Ycf46/Vps4 family AAA+-type ATPase
MGDSKKATPANVIEMLVNCINRNDIGAFYKWAEQYHQGLALGGELHGRMARLLTARPKQMKLLDSLHTKMRGLAEQYDLPDENVFVSAASRAFLEPLMTEWRNRDLYSFHNLGVRTKLLLHGPTGNGKTTIAKHLARQMDLRFVEVKADSMIDSHLGTTGRNINSVFANIKEPCLLFWDEVDSIGRRRGNGKRSDGAEVENERTVNSLLVNIERLDDSVIFVGATNRRDVLDPAFIRRFDAQFEVANPSTEEKRAFAQQLATFHHLPAGFMPTGYDGLVSLSDVKLFVVDAARRFVAQQIAAASVA